MLICQIALQQIHGGEVLPHLIGFVAPFDGTAISSAYSQGTVIVVPPALDGVVVQDGARVFVSGADHQGGFVVAQVHRHGNMAIGGIPLPQLPLFVAAPALDRVVVEDGTRVVNSNGHRHLAVLLVPKSTATGVGRLVVVLSPTCP